MDQTTEVLPGKIENGEFERVESRNHTIPRNGKKMKRSKNKVILLIAGAIVLVGLVVGGIAWSKRGVVAVQTGKVTRQDLKAIATANGEIKPPSTKFANVNANSYGKIVEIYVKEGDAVKKGQLLLRTESVQQEADVKAQEAGLLTAQADVQGALSAVNSAAAALKTSQADVDQFQANVDRARDDFARAEKLLADKLIAQQVYDQRRADYEVAEANLEAAQARVTQARAQHQQALHNRDMARARVEQARAILVRARDVKSKTEYFSPLDGILTSLPVHEGENVVPGIQNQVGSLLYQVSDLSVITAEVKVDETDIVNVKLGQEADVAIDAVPDKTFKGEVTEIGQSAIGRTSGLTSGQSSTTADEAKDFKVVVTIKDPPPGLRPGLSTTAKIVTAARKDAVTVPIQALTVRMRRDLEPKDKEKEKKGTGEVKAATAAPASTAKPETENKATGAEEKAKEEVQGVFVVRKGRAVFVPVETGIMGTKDVEIVKGLNPGEEIITGSYKVLRTLKPDTKVKVEAGQGGPAGGESPS
jgi:HlyD family secretion protein